MKKLFIKDIQFYKFCVYGFLKNLKFFAPFFLLFLKEKNINFLDIGILYAIRETIVYLTEIPSGMLADILGRKKILLIGFGFYIVSFLFFYFFSGFGVFIIAISLFALGDSFRTGTHKAMIFEYLKVKGYSQYKVIYYGHTRSCSQFGSAISSLLAAILVVFFKQNYSTIFLFSTLPYLLDAILIMTYPSFLNGKIRTKNIGLKSIFTQTGKSLLPMLKQKEKIRILLNVSSFSGFFKISKDYIQIIIQYFAISIPISLMINQKQKTALFIGLVFFMLYLLTSLASRYSEKIYTLFGNSEKTLNRLLISGILLAIISGILFYYKIYSLSLLFFGLIYINENFRKPTGVSYISEQFNSDTLTTILSISSLIKTLIGSVSAIFIGLISDMFNFGIALIAISFIFLLLSFTILLNEKK